MVEPDRPQMTIWRICFACWLSKATDTPSEYAVLNAFPWHQWLRERTLMLRVRTWPVLFLEYLFFFVAKIDKIVSGDQSPQFGTKVFWRKT